MATPRDICEFKLREVRTIVFSRAVCARRRERQQRRCVLAAHPAAGTEHDRGPSVLNVFAARCRRPEDNAQAAPFAQPRLEHARPARALAASPELCWRESGLSAAAAAAAAMCVHACVCVPLLLLLLLLLPCGAFVESDVCALGHAGLGRLAFIAEYASLENIEDAKKTLRDMRRRAVLVPECGSTPSQAALNMINVLMGSGLLALPLAVRECGGLAPGLALLVVTSACTMFTAKLLGKELERRNARGFPDLAFHAFGRVGRSVVGVVLYFDIFMAMVLFLIMAGANANAVASSAFKLHVSNTACVRALALSHHTHTQDPRLSLSLSPFTKNLSRRRRRRAVLGEKPLKGSRTF